MKRGIQKPQSTASIRRHSPTYIAWLQHTSHCRLRVNSNEPPELKSPPFLALSRHCNFHIPPKPFRISENLKRIKEKWPPTPSCDGSNYVSQVSKYNTTMMLPRLLGCFLQLDWLLTPEKLPLSIRPGYYGEELPRLILEGNATVGDCHGRFINCLLQPNLLI